eukprot:scaffold236_cov419-Prasinococcus_capsulatus_cf.AAC.11
MPTGGEREDASLRSWTGRRSSLLAVAKCSYSWRNEHRTAEDLEKRLVWADQASTIFPKERPERTQNGRRPGGEARRAEAGAAPSLSRGELTRSVVSLGRPRHTLPWTCPAVTAMCVVETAGGCHRDVPDDMQYVPGRHAGCSERPRSRHPPPAEHLSVHHLTDDCVSCTPGT